MNRILGLVLLWSIANILLVSQAAISPMPMTPRTQRIAQRAVSREFQISGALIAQLLNNATQGTVAHFHNLGPRKGDSWHQARASSIQLPSILGNLKQTFDIPEVTKVLSCGSLCPSLGTAKFYVNNFDLEDISVTYLQPEFRLRLAFESDGPEVKTYIVGPLQWLNDRAVPNVEINKARLDIFLRPMAVNGGLTYEVSRSNFTADIKATGACSLAGQDICASLFNYRNFLVAQIETKSRQLLNDGTLRNRVNALLQPQLSRLGIKSVQSVKANGDQLVLTVSR